MDSNIVLEVGAKARYVGISEIVKVKITAVLKWNVGTVAVNLRVTSKNNPVYPYGMEMKHAPVAFIIPRKGHSFLHARYTWEETP